MGTVYVQFTDKKKTAIQSVFSSPQDPDEQSNQGEIDEADERYVAYMASTVPTPALLNGVERDRRLAEAALRIAPLQDAADLDEATAEETALLKAWKKYRVTVNRIDIAMPSPTWPDRPE